MSQPLPPPPMTPPAPGPAPTASRAPGLVEAFVAVLTKPAAFFESVKDNVGFGPPVVFALVMGLLSGILTAVFTVLHLGAAAGAAGGAIGAAAGFAAILMSPIMAVIGVFIGGAIVHVISLIAGGKGSYEQSCRVAGYASAVMPIGTVLGIVPLVSILANLYGLYLVALGLVAIHGSERKRTFTVTGVLAAVVVLIGIGGWMAGRAAQKAAGDLNAQFGEGSQFQKDIQKAAVEMQRAAEEARKAAEQQQQK